MDETVPHGEIIHLPELVKAAGDMHDRSVRTIGRCDGTPRSPPLALGRKHGHPLRLFPVP